MLKQLSFISFLFLIGACKPVSEQAATEQEKVQATQCIDSQSQCQVKTELGDFTVKFSQPQLQTPLSDNIKAELPFVIELTTISLPSDKNDITKISAHLEGKEMFMGKLPVFFEKKGTEGKYFAESLLASCHEDLMTWRLWVTVDVAGKTQSFFVDFTSQS